MPTNDSESNYIWGITFRPCENKIVTSPLDPKVRKMYKAYSLLEQRLILECTVEHLYLKGLKIAEIFYEQTELQGIKLLHFHAILYHNEIATYYALKEHALLLNKRYGPVTYKAFDYKPLDTPDDLDNWKAYIRKDIKHDLMTVDLNNI